MPLVLPREDPRKEKPPLTDGGLDALASCLFEGLCLREGGVVRTLSALEAHDSQEDLVVHRLESGEVFGVESPRHNPYSSSVSNTSAFSMQTFRLSGVVAI